MLSPQLKAVAPVIAEPCISMTGPRLADDRRLALKSIAALGTSGLSKVTDQAVLHHTCKVKTLDMLHLTSLFSTNVDAEVEHRHCRLRTIFEETRADSMLPFVGSNLSVAAHRLKMKASTVALMEDKDRSQLEKKGKQSMTTDKIVRRNWQKVADSRVKICKFLIHHGFDPENVNLRKTTRSTCGSGWNQQEDTGIHGNDPEMVALLLWFGADPLHYDSRSRNAYDCATAEVKAVFEQMNAAPHSLRLCGKTKLERIPPPRGFERFFEELEKDPLVNGTLGIVLVGRIWHGRLRNSRKGTAEGK
eukprot:s836_g2.t1